MSVGDLGNTASDSIPERASPHLRTLALGEGMGYPG